MAFKAKSFLHNDDKIVGTDGSDDGVLPEDVQDFISANAGTIDGTSNINVTCTQFGSKIFTLVILDAN